jgi:glycosyltransferase involved in cell wall biosynthesis
MSGIPTPSQPRENGAELATAPEVEVLVCHCNEAAWRWFEGKVGGPGLHWKFVAGEASNWLERKITRPNVAIVRAAWRILDAVDPSKPQLLITVSTRFTFWVGALAKLRGIRLPHHLAHHFNFTRLPHGLLPRPVLAKLFGWAYSDVDHFVVHSSSERDIYARHFSLPEGKFDVLLWGMQPPRIEPPDAPVEPGDYVCAVGSNARDYRTLIKAAARLPHIKFVLVVSPHNVEGVEIPANVQVNFRVPPPRTMNIVRYSRFMALPLEHQEVACGHVTMVAAMHLGRAFVATAASGVREYARHEENCLTCEPGDVDALTAAIERLWNDRALCERMGERGRALAAEQCSEESAMAHLDRYLREQRARF